MEDNKPPEMTNDWVESKEHFSQGYIRDILFFEMHCFQNFKSKFYFEGLAVFNILDENMVLMARNFVITDSNDKLYSIHYLKLADGSWVKSEPSTGYDCELNFDPIGNMECLLTAIVSIKTKDGIKSRVLIKKCKTPQ